MPAPSDASEIRAILETDRTWGAYALGDLAPGFFEDCEWHCAADQPALILLYRAFDAPVLLTFGRPGAVRLLLEEIGDEPRLYLSVRPEILPLVRERYTVQDETAMWRMALDRADFVAPESGNAVRLRPSDLPALQRLFADGEAAGEGPVFFDASMLGNGVYCAVRNDDGELLSVAGTHLVVPAESVAAIGNVYTHRDRRGQGLGTEVTAAVAAELLRMNLRTIVLNVSQANTAAISVYKRVGFRPYCPFYEGLAVRE